MDRFSDRNRNRDRDSRILSSRRSSSERERYHDRHFHHPRSDTSENNSREFALNRLEQDYQVNPGQSAAVRLVNVLMQSEENDLLRGRSLTEITNHANSLVNHLGDLHEANNSLEYHSLRNRIWEDITTLTSAAATSESSMVRGPIFQFLQEIELANQT